MLNTYSGSTIILDESSMISVVEMDRFLKNVEKLGVEKIVLMGDTEQIKSLSAGATLVAITGYAFSSTYENFYVAISRAKSYLHVFTDDKKQLQHTVEQSAKAETEHAVEHDNSERTEDVKHIDTEKTTEDDHIAQIDQDTDKSKSDDDTKSDEKTNRKDFARPASDDKSPDSSKDSAANEQHLPVALEFRDMPEDRSRGDRSQ